MTLHDVLVEELWRRRQGSHFRIFNTLGEFIARGFINTIRLFRIFHNNSLGIFEGNFRKFTEKGNTRRKKYGATYELRRFFSQNRR